MWQDISRDEKTLRPCFYVKHAGYDVISSPGNRKKVRIMKNLKEQLMHMVFLLSACVSILCVAMICVFLFANGIPAIGKIGIFQFLAGEKWKPGNNIFGILPMILGSIYVTAGAVLIGVPIGILTAVFMSRFCPKPVYKVVKPAIDLLAGIPSVVYGFFGMVVIVPVVSQLFGGSGKSMLTASILLGIMILPTIIGVSESAINAVPSSYYEGSLALGASHERSVFFATLPAAKSGILAGVILGVGRIVGETAALIYTAGSVTGVPDSLMSSGRTLAVHMYALLSEGLYTDEAYATAVVLLVLVFIINRLSAYVANKIQNR